MSNDGLVGQFPIGDKNCITDVAGVKVGHVTLDFPLGKEDEYACTGVTAILPHSDNLFREKVPAASYVINGFGKTTGLVQVDELGVIESPIMLTNTFAVPAVTQGALQFMLEETPEVGETTGTINVVTGECNDSYLNSIRHFSVKSEHAVEALRKASTNRADEGAVGAGKGMVCFGFKGGIGTTSRVISTNDGPDIIVGCLVLTNFGKKEEFQQDRYAASAEPESGISETSDGSVIIVLATDAALSDRQLKRVAKRCGIGLGRTGSHYSNGSGDIVIAFSTANRVPHSLNEMIESRTQLRDDHQVMNKLFTCAAEVTEEAILHSLKKAETTTGRKDRVVYSMNREKLQPTD